MLQPRLNGCGSVRMAGSRNSFGVRWSVCALIFFLTTLVTCQDLNNEEVSRIKRDNVPENRDLTVLLVNDQQRNEYNTKTGRFHNVKPLIGLLTSTARTFIQDGVTTEFATQILGTTLDNGRIYAQLLTKSSLVLYSKPSSVEDDVLVKPTRIHSAFDGEWNVKQDLGFIDPDKFALKNTDYLAPSKMDIVYASKPTQENIKYWHTPTAPDNIENQIIEEPTGRRVQQYNEIPRYNQNNDIINYLDDPLIENEKKIDLAIEPSILGSVNTLHRQSKAYETNNNVNKLDSRVKEDTLNETNIVKVKPNYDLPTFTVKNEFSPIFYYIDNVETRNSQAVVGQTKLPSKKFFGQKSEPRPKKTFTYAGFADFTTVVGDTVIIFTPNTETSRPQSPDEVNIFPSAKRINKLGTKVTHLAADIPVATSTYKAYEAKTTTKLTTPSNDENRSQKALYNDEDSLKKVLYEVDKMPDSISVQYNNGFDLNLDVIQPSESAITTTERTRFTDDLDVISIKDVNSVATEPLATLRPSATIAKGSQESILTDKDVADMFRNSEEESDNNGSEVTDEDEDTTTEMESEIGTTTENGQSDEAEELEATTESSADNEEVVCTQGLEIQSTMTTAYRTLTYLTTYFIPLEKSETTTSIKSDVVVESTVGYLTNVACKTALNIKPTEVVSVDIKSSVYDNLEKPESTSEESVAKPAESEAVTEDLPKTTQTEKETTTQENNVTASNTEESSAKQDKVEKASTTTSTTTERVEVSISTEKSTTPDGKTTPMDATEETSEENEIDLIYKTLYTTYTYFTTFFGDQTSSVASHKSVITNIITSTIDLSKLDPKLLGAFDEDEIAPTSVGIGRPTESFAINSIIDLVKNKDVIESVEIDEKYSSQTPTPTLDDDLVTSIKPDAVKTYFTTYTFFTTIYVGTDANVCSRNEVYTNYVGPEELIPTKTTLTPNTKANFDFRNCKQIKNANPPANPEENSSMESSVSIEENKDRTDEENKKKVSPKPSPLEVDMLFSVESNPLDEGLIQTDIKSSSSKGEIQYLENNNILDDQISSESNIDEIMPSPTLLLQTSYTTFTYFTTMYIGKDSSKVKSRLETITNVVTETIMPKKEIEEESNLPITYYTTFTYWTTLYKDKSTTITSREEIVSNVVTPTVQIVPTENPIDTTPIDIDTDLPPKALEVELKPSLVKDGLETDDGKATFYTTYTYFTTFYAGNTSQIRSSLETVTNIIDHTKVVEDNQLGRKVPSGAAEKNLIQDKREKIGIVPTVVKEEIIPTKLPDLSSGSPTVILGTYIDNLFAEVKQNDNTTPSQEGEKKILFSQVAVISGDSNYVTSDNKTLQSPTNTSTATTARTEGPLVSSTPDVIQSSVSEEPESTTESKPETEEEDDGNSRKKSRLTFTSRKPSFTPVIIPFASRNRPTFSPKARVPALGSATTITRADFTPTITATPTLKSVRNSGFGGNRKASAFPGSSAPARRFTGKSSSVNPAANVPSPSRASGFGRGSIQPTSRRGGFRSSSLRSNSLDYASRSAVPRIKPTASLRLRGGRQSASVSLPPQDQNESETSVTQQEENSTEPSEEVTEAPVKTTSNPLSRFRRPPLGRQPGTAVTPRSTTASSRRAPSTRGRATTTTRKPTTRSTTNPLLSLRRQRPNALFPKRNLFKQPDPEPEEAVKKEEQKSEENEEILEEEEFEDDNDYESSDRKEQQVTTPSTPSPRKKTNAVQIRPFSFRRRTKRQVDYGNRKYSNFRRPAGRTTRLPEPEPETEPPAPVTPKSRNGNRYSSRLSGNTRTTTASSLPKSSARKPFIIRGESRATTTAKPAYRRAKVRPSSRTTTLSSRPKAPRLSSSQSRPSSRSSGRTRISGRTTTSRNRQRGSYENFSGERYNNYNHIANDGKYTVTYQIPTEVTIPVVNGKITEYKSVISASPSVQTILENQVSTSIGPLGNPQLVLISEATELGDNGATKLIKFLLHETPTTAVIFTPTTIRGRKTSYSHVVPSTVYNVEPITQTVNPEINANVPLANLLLSQLLLGNQQPQINPLLALQGQGLLPQQPVAQTPVTEFKTRATTYVTTVTDARETVLTITFRATPIETTIKDPTTKVITATEYITETLVTTPTAFAQPQPQFNSQLLLLLQQQQQQQQAISLQTANPLLGLGQQDLNLLHSNSINDSPKPNVLSDLNSNEEFTDDVQEQDENDDIPPPPPPPPKRTRNKPKPPKPAPPKHTSVVTLYVSGRYPGEFSTVLSTVVADDTQNVRKREAIYYEDVKIQSSLLPSVDELVGSQSDVASELTGIERYLDNSVESQLGTESLESIVGELNKHIRYDASPTPVVKLASPSTGRDPNISLDEVS